MSPKSAVSSATASTKAIVHQLCVAVEKCFEMKAGEKVYVEKYGDVTTGEREQEEVKIYSDSLTDNHENFWKTLKNWVHDDFDQKPYSALILNTTQAFGEKATLASFNGLDIGGRLALIRAIYDKSLARMEARRKKDAKVSESAVLKFQHYVFDEIRERKLELVVAKLFIEARSPDLPQLYSDIKQVWLKGILEVKKDAALDTLIGFVTKPNAAEGEDWEITYKEFDAQLADLHQTYGSETRKFPRACFDSSTQLAEDELSHYLGFEFVKKIQDIEYHDMIQNAVREYLQTVETINTEFKSYSVSSQRTMNYSNEVLRRFNSMHRMASRHCTDTIKDSQSFYDARTGEESLQFEGFADRPLMPFRNGVLHMALNDDEELVWRLKKDE